MASVNELIGRADALVLKYGRYDVALQPLERAEKGADAFDAEVLLIQGEIENLVVQADEVSKIKNRATVAARNAEIRRSKNNLRQKRIEGLYKKAKKGKNLTNQILTTRIEIINSLVEKINAIPDGVRTVGGPSRPGGSGESAMRDKYSGQASGFTRLDMGNAAASAEQYQHTDETRAFEQDWQRSKARQDAALDRIEHGVGVLGNLARDMNQEIAVQNPILDAIEDQMDRVGGELKTRNQQLKGALQKMRSSRNFCVDIVLLVVLLALGAYVYSIVT